MLKFFRRIRQRLLKEGKLRRYFVYAIGEIFLVVIGILIAIQLNLANEKRKDRVQLNQHLLTIKSDLLEDLEDWQTKYENALTRDREGMYLIQFLKDELEATPDTGRLRKAFLLANTIYELSPNRIGYENLISSGRLQLIGNEDLQVLLDDYYVFETQSQSQRQHYRVNLSDDRFNYIDPLMLREHLIEQMNSDIPSEAALSSYKVDWQKLKKEGSFKQKLSTFWRNF